MSDDEALEQYLFPVSRAAHRRELLARRAWESLSPYADPSRGVHVRLNAYELAVFQAAAASEERVQQQVARRLIREWSEKVLGIGSEQSTRERELRLQLQQAQAEVARIERELEDA